MYDWTRLLQASNVSMSYCDIFLYDIFLARNIVIVALPWICLTKVKVHLSLRDKLRMRSYGGEYDYDDLKLVLSVDGIMGSRSCIAQVVFEVTWEVYLLWYEGLKR